MSIASQYQLMAKYNQWMNSRLYAAAAQLEPPQLHADRGAFFGSVFNTLNHIMVADTIWLKRFADHPAAFRSLELVRSMSHPYSLSQPLHADFEALQAARVAMDNIIVNLCSEVTDAVYATPLSYVNSTGASFERRLGLLMQHFFNHQTHHRGQITTLLNQAGVDVGVTDLSALIPEYGDSR